MIEVRAGRGETMGACRVGDRRFDCALGRSGIVPVKHEGDGGTPRGTFRLREVFWRPDRGPAPATALPISALTPLDGWCDDPADAAYNRRVSLPFQARHEALWRDDGLYDLFAVIGCNDDPPVPGAGSAIFLHVARAGPDGLEPTEGCVALSMDDLRAVLAVSGPGTWIDIAEG